MRSPLASAPSIRFAISPWDWIESI